jgi:hypothetical protein
MMIDPLGRGGRMTRRLVALVTMVVALTLVLAGAAAALTKDEYIEAADNICAQAEQLRSEFASGAFATLGQDEEPTFDMLAEYAANIEPITRQEIDSLRALDPPAEDQKKIDKIIDKYEKIFDKIVDDPNKLLRPNLFRKIAKATTRYGFRVCGGEGD